MSTPPGDEQEPGHRVTDRRRVRLDGPGEPDPSSAEQRSEEGSAPQVTQEPDLLTLPVPDLVRLFIMELQTRALLHLGLIPHPTTHRVEKDLSQVRLAIDCLAALVEQLIPSVAAAERSALEGMLAQLRVHFVEQSRG